MNNVAELKQPEQKSLVETFANRYQVEANKLIPALKQTAFNTKQEITDAQMMALLVVANQYLLNPFTKEIYAYPDKGGIVPVVSVDGWARIINSNPEADGIEFNYSDETVEFNGHQCHEWVECSIYRKGRSRPVTVREYFDEVKRELNYANPWKTHPKRMHRHKTLIQCARLAFGFAGIYEQDEAERIMESKAIQDSHPASGLSEPYSQEQHDYFHKLVESKEAIGMYAFMVSVSEGVQISLYNSFEKGMKTRGKQVVSQLQKDGYDLLQQIAADMNGAKDSCDEVAFDEATEGLQEDELNLVLEMTEPETQSFYREISK